MRPIQAQFRALTCILGAWSPRGVSTYLFTEMPELLIQNSTFQMQSLFGSSYNLGQKVLRILYFLTHRTPIHRIGTAMATPLAPPWSKLSSQDQKWSSWNSTFFLEGVGSGSICSRQCFQELSLKLDMVTSIFLNIFVQDGKGIKIISYW